jgi:uncharacterized protein (DUF849 family)
VLAASIEPAWRAGAAIAHIHAPPATTGMGIAHAGDTASCGIMIQYGISTQTVRSGARSSRTVPT